MAIALDDLLRKIRNVTKDFEHEQQASGVIVTFDVVLDGQIITVQPITDLYAPMQDSISADELPPRGDDAWIRQTDAPEQDQAQPRKSKK